MKECCEILLRYVQSKHSPIEIKDKELKCTVDEFVSKILSRKNIDIFSVRIDFAEIIAK